MSVELNRVVGDHVLVSMTPALDGNRDRASAAARTLLDAVGRVGLATLGVASVLYGWPYRVLWQCVRLLWRS